MATKLARIACAGLLCAASSHFSLAQQVADSSYQPKPIAAPMHSPARGPVVLVDAGHNNFHTSDGLYEPFATLLRADGYNVEARQGKFAQRFAGGAKVLVIATAQNALNVSSRQLPAPSAFADAEIDALVEFVSAGGGLLLIVDQMPFPGAAHALAARFSLELPNDVVGELDAQGKPVIGPTTFTKSGGGIADHAITRGRNAAEAIDRVMSFSGSAFPVTGKAASLIRYGDNGVVLFPTVAREFENVPRALAPGWSQGVAIEHGMGRVVIFGEAAMFSSQQAGTAPPIGLTSPEAEDNQQLVLNIVRWLAADL
jgi:hypothetical protein